MMNLKGGNVEYLHHVTCALVSIETRDIDLYTTSTNNAFFLLCVHTKTFSCFRPCMSHHSNSLNQGPCNNTTGIKYMTMLTYPWIGAYIYGLPFNPLVTYMGRIHQHSIEPSTSPTRFFNGRVSAVFFLSFQSKFTLLEMPLILWT